MSTRHITSVPIYYLHPPHPLRYIEVSTGPGKHFVFSIQTYPDMERYTVGFSLLQRKWATLSLNQELIVKPFSFETRKTVECLTNVTLEVDFLQKKVTTTESYDSDAMAKEFLFQFPNLALTVGQSLVFSFADKKLLGLVVRSLDAVDIQQYQSNADKCDVKKTNFGRLLGNTTVTFEKAENSALNLTGKAKGGLL